MKRKEVKEKIYGWIPRSYKRVSRGVEILSNSNISGWGEIYWPNLYTFANILVDFCSYTILYFLVPFMLSKTAQYGKYKTVMSDAEG